MKHVRIDQKTFDDVKRLLEIKAERGWKKEVARIFKLSKSAIYKIDKTSDYPTYDRERTEWAKQQQVDKKAKSTDNGLKPVIYGSQTEVLLSSIDHSLKGILSLLLKQENARQETKGFWGKLNSKQV